MMDMNEICNRVILIVTERKMLDEPLEELLPDWTAGQKKKKKQGWMRWCRKACLYESPEERYECRTKRIKK